MKLVRLSHADLYYSCDVYCDGSVIGGKLHGGSEGVVDESAIFDRYIIFAIDQKNGIINEKADET